MSARLTMALSDRFAAINFNTRKGCSDCWAKYYCGGGCSAANIAMNGDLLRPYELGCELERKRVECAIYLKAALQSRMLRSFDTPPHRITIRSGAPINSPKKSADYLGKYDSFYK